MLGSALLLIGTGVIAWFERKQQLNESLLRDAKQRLELATTSGRLGVWERNLSSGELIWNERMYEIYGFAAGTFTGHVEEFQRALHPDDRARVLEAIRAAIRGEKTYAEEFRVLLPDGTERFIKSSGLVIRDAAGEAVRMTSA